MEKLLEMLAKVKLCPLDEVDAAGYDRAVELGLVENIVIEEASYVQLTDAGELYIRTEGIYNGNLYRCFQLEKCIKVMKHYMVLKEETKNSWRTKDDMMVVTKNHHVPDASYILPNGIVRGVKVINNQTPLEFIRNVENNREVLGIDEMMYIF